MRNSGNVGWAVFANLLDALNDPLLVAEGSGKVVFANAPARLWLEAKGLSEPQNLNLFEDLLHVDAKSVSTQLQEGEHEVSLPIVCPEGNARARVRWLPEPDWLIVHVVDPIPAVTSENAEMQ